MTESDDTGSEQDGDNVEVEIVVEIPRGSRNKYEERDHGVIWFDRRLGGPAAFPGDYGYIVGVEGEDGDALDALVLLEEGTFPGVHMQCRVLGSYLLQVGEIQETKVICVPVHDHHQDHIRELRDLSDNLREELGAFFEAYRMLESGEVNVLEHRGLAATLKALRATASQS